MTPSATLSARIAKFCRLRGDGIRSAYAAGRRLRHLPEYVQRRRIAAQVVPPAEFLIPERVGFRMFAPGAIAEANEIVAESQLLLTRADAKLAERRKARESKQFLINLLDPGELNLDSPFLRLALRPDLLSAVIAYLDTVPVLRSIQVFYSGFQEREPISSQLYHCDADDTRQVKVFVLCSPVEDANGPLTFLDAESSERVRRAVGYQFKGRLTDEQVDAVAGAGRAQPLVGEPATTCLLDTSRCLHFGSRVKPGAAPRLVAVIQYVTPFAFVLSGDHRAGAAFSALASQGLRPLQRGVLTGTPLSES